MLRTASLTVAVSKSPGHVFCNAYPWALRPTTERPTAPTYDRIVASPFSTVLELDGISGTVVLDLEPLILGTKSRKSSKMATNQGENCPGLRSLGCGRVFRGAINRSSEKVSSNRTVLELASRLADISRYMGIYILYDVIFRFIVYIQATKSLKCAAVAQWRSAGTYYDLYCYSEYYRPPPPPGHQTGRRTRRWLASLGAVFGSDGLEWCSPLEFRDDGGNS